MVDPGVGDWQILKSPLVWKAIGATWEVGWSLRVKLDAGLDAENLFKAFVYSSTSLWRSRTVSTMHGGWCAVVIIEGVHRFKNLIFWIHHRWCFSVYTHDIAVDVILSLVRKLFILVLGKVDTFPTKRRKWVNFVFIFRCLVGKPTESEAAWFLKTIIFYMYLIGLETVTF